MQSIKEILKKSRSQINWFGMGEAVRLVQEIDNIDKDTDFVKLAGKVIDFLQFSNVDNAYNLSEELKTALEKKGIIHGQSKRQHG